MPWRAFGPAVARPPRIEVLRAALGAGLALGLLAWAVNRGWLGPGAYLVAPFGASAVLLFAVPSSPLAQPWSVVIGNVSAALVGVAVCALVADPGLRLGLSVGLAIAAMMALRAMHPPAGAVAMTVALMAQPPGPGFALWPVGLGSLALVALAMVWARVWGRSYPLRDTRPSQGLEAILTQTGQEWNITPEDLAGLIDAATLQAAAGRIGAPVAGDIMTRNPLRVNADLPVADLADLFARHRFAALPVVTEGDRFVGMVAQIDLIARARSDALRLGRGFGPVLARLVDRRQPATAADIMTAAPPRAVASTPLGLILPLLADGRLAALPVLEKGRIIGIITRTDLLTALAAYPLPDSPSR